MFGQQEQVQDQVAILGKLILVVVKMVKAKDAPPPPVPDPGHLSDDNESLVREPPRSVEAHLQASPRSV